MARGRRIRAASLFARTPGDWDGFHQEEMFPRMEKHVLFQPTIKRAALPASVFLLPGILPADRRLLFDPETHTVLLLTVAGSDAVPMFQSFQVPPSASRVFFTLLQAFPQYCSHQTLFRSLYPQIPEEDQQEWNWQQMLAVPLVRRALKALLPVLRGCGLQAISLRGQGYVLAAITHPQVFPEQERQAAAQGHQGEQR